MGFLPNHGRAPERDLPRKTGLPRLWETLSRDFWDLFRAGFLALVGCVPFILGLAYSLSTHVLVYAPVFGLLGGALAGPGLCGLADTVLRGLRDEPGFWWRTYRRAWVRNAKASLLPGALGGGLLAALAAGVLLVLALSLYLWPQLALMELSFPQLVKNSALLFIGQLPRSLAALAILAAYLGLTARFFTLAVSLLPFTNLWLPVLPALFLVYPGINENFRIEEKLGGN